jgi:hypothetical protein
MRHFCLALLIALVPTTRGFSKCNGLEVIGLAIASAAGGVALLGIAALVIGAAMALIVLAILCLPSPRRLEGRQIMRGLALVSPSHSQQVQTH